MAAARQRLVEAMATVAARHGYAEASVARVVKQAGMSRATFYEHFEDRDDCFLAAFHWAAEPVREELNRDDGPTASPGRPAEAIELLLAAADAHPAAARLVLIEAMAGDARVRAAHEELLDEVEAVLDRYLDAAAEHRPPLEIPVRALLGGVGNLVGMRVFRQEGSLAYLGEDLVAWLESYALPPGRRRLHQSEWQELGEAWAAQGRESRPARPTAAKRPSRGRGRPAPTDVAGQNRRRVFDAIARCCCEKGYTATTVADLVATAGITRGAFYEQFRSKEDAFLAVQTEGLQGGAAAAAERFFSDASWRERVWRGSAGLVEYLAKRPDLAHMHLIESYSVGPKAIRRSFENRMAFTIFLEEGYRQRPEAEWLPRLCGEVIAGATEELFRRQAARGREPDRELLPQAAYLALAPFIGAEAALDFVTERCRIAA